MKNPDKSLSLGGLLEELLQGQRPRLLVVEDEPHVGEICLRVLGREGFDVEIAANGHIGLGFVIQYDYDFCLLDIRTPGMSGKELYKWLLENRTELASRVIFTTGDIMAQDLLAFIKHTGRPFLPKPFSPDELVKIVKETWKEIISRPVNAQ
ncbi:DNA-binding heavy metal response regulator [Dehalogenimonas sp. WBC-2]|nr:DNA-binding heavy metal response regulator [Dehalogenimonas sp. WBC-2]